MQPPNDIPPSFVFFQILCGSLFAILLSVTLGLVYGPLNLPLSFIMGFSGAFLFHAVFKAQVTYTYWWLRVWWEIRIKNNDS